MLLSAPRISYAFFLPSQVVSPTYMSATLKYGQVLPKWAPNDAFTSGHISLGSTFLAIGHPELGPAAQARDRAAARNNDFIGHVHAKRAEHLSALFLQLNELGRTNTMNVRYHEIIECHARWTVFLAQIHIAKRRGKHGAQLVMGFQVHAEVLPHFTIVCHVRFPLRAKAASHPWGHAHTRPSRSVSNNYHATNHQPIRNKGAKKENVERRCRMADALQMRERCLAFEAYGAYASRAE